MIGFALLLRPAGYIIATTLFLTVGAYVLGEKRLHLSVPIGLVTSVSTWYIVQVGLGIYLVPLPAFMGMN